MSQPLALHFPTLAIKSHVEFLHAIWSGYELGAMIPATRDPKSTHMNRLASNMFPVLPKSIAIAQTTSQLYYC